MYQKSYQSVKIELDPLLTSVDAKIYHFDHDNDREPTKEDLAASVNSSQSIRLKRGGYKIIVNKTKDFKELEVRFSVIDKPVDVVIKPDYSDEKTAQLLPGVQRIVTKELLNIFPDLEKKFVINPGQLYQNGVWFATTLTSVSKSPDDNDTLRVVAQKKGETWSITTSPPDIIISGVVYTTIPKDVLKKVNSL